MKKLGLLIVLSMVNFASVSFAEPTVYSGSLNGSSSGGLKGSAGTNVWLSGNTVFSWIVTDYHDGRYGYEYNLKVQTKPISHFIIEVSPTFQESNILQYLQGSFALSDYGPENGGGINLYIPGSMRGIKTGSGVGSYTLQFISDRMPVWGDFYAKSTLLNGVVAIWNAGFTSADTDPTAGPANGSIDCHILVPDSTSLPIAPVPGAVVLGGIGIGLVRLFHRQNAR
ncbi:MAG: hypothetical protein GX455_05210 [Phycisphaerae bacterium]|nr:hypothetical protein [Phycisphaerae bacterium]